MRILYITNIPSPYVVDFLNELGKRVEVYAVFERKDSSERDSSWKSFKAKNFGYRILTGISYDVDKAIAPGVIGEISKRKDWRIVLSNPATITGLLAIAYMKALKIPYALQVEGGVPIKKSGIKGLIKRFAFSGATHYYSSGAITDQYLRLNGADVNRISRYPFTSLSQSDLIFPSEAQKKQNRADFGVSDSFTILSVGRFVYGKGIDILLEALGKCDKSIQAIIIGGEPTDDYMRIIKKYCLNNVRFVGFQSKDIVLKWMRAVDIYVMPTRHDVWGLVVNEAMSQGLPVISSDNCVAAKEMIVPGENGELFENENAEELANIISDFRQSERWKNMRQAAYQTAQMYTFEKMAEAHLDEWSENGI